MPSHRALKKDAYFIGFTISQNWRRDLMCTERYGKLPTDRWNPTESYPLVRYLDESAAFLTSRSVRHSARWRTSSSWPCQRKRMERKHSNNSKANWSSLCLQSNRRSRKQCGQASQGLHTSHTLMSKLDLLSSPSVSGERALAVSQPRLPARTDRLCRSTKSDHEHDK
jgi:hypothetical protein